MTRLDVLDEGGNEKKAEAEQPTGLVDIARKWPKVTFCILANEFCERFSYYGMRSVLTIYFIHYLGFQSNTSTVLFHAFTVFAYTSPLFGSMLADGYIGKFWTIFVLSLVYAFGQVTLAVASSFSADHFVHPWLDLLGLLVIAIGTGGIKPCVSAFGGDQFNPSWQRMIAIFFSVFYFSINAGSTISMFVTPLFRAIPCMGQTSCFPLAFGIPAALMVIATALFLLGSPWYKRMPLSENVILRVLTTIQRAVRNRFSSCRKREHWLDHAMDEHACAKNERCQALAKKAPANSNKCSEATFVKDIKSLLRVIVMMLSFPMFWALYDQQGSRWTIQAMSMDPRITRNFSLLPEQMQTLNAILILVMIPLFQVLIYPTLEKCGIKMTSLRRMACGGLLAAFSFILCGFVQIAVEKSMASPAGSGEAFVTFINSFNHSIGCNFDIHFEKSSIPLRANSSLVDDSSIEKEEIFKIPLPNGPAKHTFKLQLQSERADCPKAFDVPLGLKERDNIAVLLTPHGYATMEITPKKPKQTMGEFGVNLLLDLDCDKLKKSTASGIDCDGSVYRGAVFLCKSDQPCNREDKLRFHEWQTSTEQKIIAYNEPASGRSIFVFPTAAIILGSYRFYLNDSSTGMVAIPNSELTISDVGSVVNVVVSNEGLLSVHRSVPANSVSILWQIPQYIVMTAAEVLFSVTGYEFSYAEASPALKSVVQALYLLMVAFGDIFIIIITQLQLFKTMVGEMFFFAVAMIIVMIIFILLSIFYYDYAHFESEEEMTAHSSEFDKVELKDQEKNL